MLLHFISKYSLIAWLPSAFSLYPSSPICWIFRLGIFGTLASNTAFWFTDIVLQSWLMLRNLVGQVNYHNKDTYPIHSCFVSILQGDLYLLLIVYIQLQKDPNSEEEKTMGVEKTQNSLFHLEWISGFWAFCYKALEHWIVINGT